MEIQTHEKEKLKHLVLDSLIEPAVIISKEGIILYANQSWSLGPIHNGKKLNDYIGSRYLSLYDKHHVNLKEGVAHIINSDLTKFNYQMDISTIYGHQTYVIRITPLKEDQSEIFGALIVYFNVTDEKKLVQTLKFGADQYRLIANHSNDMIKVTDIYGNVEYASPSHELSLGYVDQSNIFEYVHPDETDKLKGLYSIILQNKEPGQLEIRKKNKEGNWIWVEAVCSPVLLDDGTIQHLIVISRDISERKKLQLELERMAFHDYLTGLYNRRKMKMLMEEVVAEAKNIGRKISFLLMDLDKFKQINDNHGHDIGDFILKEFSQRLLRNKREEDAVGRLSGDEFLLIMNGIAEKDEIEQFITRFQNSLLEPCCIPDLGENIPLITSIGYSIYPDNGVTVKELYKYADIALYKDKRKRFKLPNIDSITMKNVK